jgi:hypothetical protein
MLTLSTTSSLLISSKMQTSPTLKVLSLINADQPAENLSECG